MSMGNQIRQRYTDDEYNAIEKAAGQTGFTMSAFVKSAVLEKVYGKQAKGHHSQIDLVKLMKADLDGLDPGSTFIVSDLLKLYYSFSKYEEGNINGNIRRI